MKVIIVDDEAQVRENLALAAKAAGYDYATYGSVESAWEELRDDSRLDLVVILDHDFLGQAPGYELSRRLRHHHPMGLLLPIIYLTGRESPDGYLEQFATGPMASPTIYLHKADLLKHEGILNRILQQYDEELARMHVLADEQGAQRALLYFGEPHDDAVEDELE